MKYFHSIPKVESSLFSEGIIIQGRRRMRFYLVQVPGQLTSWSPTGQEAGTRLWMSLWWALSLIERLDLSISAPGHTLEVAFNEKCRDYLEACEREGISFIPLPVESLGGWHKRAVDQLRKLAKAQARSTGKEHWQGGGREHQAPVPAVGGTAGQGECSPPPKQNTLILPYRARWWFVISLSL